MTRINCVPVQELHPKHLVAEYRELPRVFKLAEAAYKKRLAIKAPEKYTLGSGHVKFFYSRLGYCKIRFQNLVAEMISRGYSPNFVATPEVDLPPSWYGDWSPDDEALSINRKRIAERLPK